MCHPQGVTVSVGEADGAWVELHDGNWAGTENVKAAACRRDFTVFH